MQEYIDKIKEIAYDYHRPLTDENINLWISQFDEEDREFLLSEVVHILDQTYLPEDEAKEILKIFLEGSAEKNNFDNVEDFLDNITFLKCQEVYKSQSILLDYLKDIVLNKYGKTLSINDLSKSYWIYVDDNLSSGGTYYNNIKTKIEEYTKESFFEDNKKIFSWFFYLHDWGYRNVTYRLKQNYNITTQLKFSYIQKITNYTKHINYYNNPKLNCAYIKNYNNQRVINYLDSLPGKLGYDQMYNRDVAFRPDNKPDTESFFSSIDARERYEKIILEKGLDIIDRIEHQGSSTRPLGFTLPSHQTLGLGSHVFTWRNTSNTCPIVYWWESNGWHPLFPVQNRGIGI